MDYGEKNILGTPRKIWKTKPGAAAKTVSELTALSSGCRLGLLFLKSFLLSFVFQQVFYAYLFCIYPAIATPMEFYMPPLSFFTNHLSLFLYFLIENSFARNHGLSQLLVSLLIDCLLLGGISFDPASCGWIWGMGVQNPMLENSSLVYWIATTKYGCSLMWVGLYPHIPLI